MKTEYKKGETLIVKEGEMDGFIESGHINLEEAEELGFFQVTEKEETTLYRIIFVKDFDLGGRK